MNIYTIADVLTGLVEAILLFSFLGVFCEKREQFPKWTYGAGIVALTIAINLSNYVFRFGILNSIGIIVCFLIFSMLFKGNMTIKVIVSLISYLLIIIIEVIVLFAIALIFNASVAEVVNNHSYRLLGIIISKALTLAGINAFRFKFGKYNFKIGISYWIMFFLIFVNSLIAVFLIFKLSYDSKTMYLYDISMFCSIGLLFSTLFALYLYERLARQSELVSKQQRFEQQIKSQSKHLDEILVTQDKLKKFKHDFSHYVTAMVGYLKNKDYAGGMKYIESITFLPKDSTDEFETGNTALDAIINSKKFLAENKGIDFQVKLQLPEMLPIDPVDICIIWGNALDNAIEACEKIETGERRILLTIVYENDCVFCKIVNSMHKRYKFAGTTKKDKCNHGFGLENIKTTLEKYNGDLEFYQTDTEFILKFILYE